MQNQEPQSTTSPAEALELLDQAWAYYSPVPAAAEDQREPELFEYANAA
ncbi:hypothetical protein [Ruegeria sp. Ofav3-42]|nr:hypothetical protein [Ruegeria sp. Ofav3-42]MCG7520167.1 hypothetical protein [Ruegeria sp. Ofav3-42]